MPRKVALRCTSSDKHDDAHFEWAIVTLTKDLLDRIALRRGLFAYVKACDKDLSAFRSYDSSGCIQFCAESDFESWILGQQEEPEDAAWPQWFEAMRTGGSEIELPENFSLEDTSGAFQVDFYMMVIRGEMVSWECTPKHTFMTIETDYLEYGSLKQDVLASSTS